MDEFLPGLPELLQSTVVVFGVCLILFVMHRRLLSMYAEMPSKQFRRQLIMLGSILAGILLTITLLPLTPGLKGQLVGLLGLLLSAAIALSSTTLVGNSMAGIMLRVVKHCQPGHFIKVGEYFGRITEMDLLHTEIQTEDRDLTTFPNLFLVTNPVTVLRSSGSIVAVEVSLGYENSRKSIETLLSNAAEKVGLEEPFVQIRELGDFSITYRAAGLLTDVKRLISTRRALRGLILDTLHESGVEIVSPTFMNTRALGKADQMIPSPAATHWDDAKNEVPEKILFDKADKAESIQALRERFEKTGEQIKTVEAAIADAKPEEKPKLEEKLTQLQARSTRLQEIVRRAEEKFADHD